MGPPFCIKFVRGGDFGQRGSGSVSYMLEPLPEWEAAVTGEGPAHSRCGGEETGVGGELHDD